MFGPVALIPDWLMPGQEAQRRSQKTQNPIVPLTDAIEPGLVVIQKIIVAVRPEPEPLDDLLANPIPHLPSLAWNRSSRISSARAPRCSGLGSAQVCQPTPERHRCA